MTVRWYVVRSHPHKENLARQHLTHRGFVSFLPHIERTIRRFDRFVTVKRPLFPGYLFVSLDLERQRWRIINSTLSVHSIVCHGDNPSPLPEGVLEATMQACDEDGILSAARQEVRRGDMVEVVRGPFAGFVGELTGLDGQGRVNLLLNLLSNSLKVKARRKDVVVVDG